MAENVTDQERDAGEAAAVQVETLGAATATKAAPRDVIFDVDDINVFYGESKAIRNVTLDIRRNEITALIGPSGCGKSTFIRCLNRMNDLIPGTRVDGTLLFHGADLDAGDRGPDAGSRQAVHDRDRHPQHAAGRARLAQDRLLQRRRPRQGPALRGAGG